MYVQRARARQLDSRYYLLPAVVLDDAEESAQGFHLPLDRFPRRLWVILILGQSHNLRKVPSNA
jgi:hypothetical protein